MNQLDNYELSSIHYTLFYYMDNANLDEDEMEWIGLLRDKVESIMVSQMNYDMECGQDSKITVTSHCNMIKSLL